MKISELRLGFVGFGHMAQVIFKAIDQARLLPRSQVGFVRRDRDKIKQNEREFGITATSLHHLADVSDLLILGVRPSQVPLVLEELKRVGLREDKWIVSIAAGVKLEVYQKLFSNQLLRVMPNLASLVGVGMSVFTYGPAPSVEFKSAANLLFSCMGEVMEVGESMMDISCAIAGSGPGLVLSLIEAMAREGERAGLSYAQALKMAAQTFLGSAQLVLKEGETQTLLNQIAVPRGTTEAGLKTMRSFAIEEHFRAAIASAAKRSKELSEEIQ